MAHLLVMDGYEDLPILLSVIQSNKVNIYCIYIKNYPEIEWRRVAFIGVFPGVRSPRMKASGEERKCRTMNPKSLYIAAPASALSRRRHAPSLCPELWMDMPGHSLSHAQTGPEEQRVRSSATA